VSKSGRARLARERAQIELNKKSLYSPPLLAFDQSVQAYADRRLSLGDYVDTLPDTAGFPTLARFRETVALEKGLNFSKVEAERLRLISEMERRLAGPEMDSLVADAEAFRAGHLRAGAFYGRLNSRAERLGLLKSDMSNLSAYFRYVERADGIDAERLMEELATAEKDGYARLVKTDDQRRLVERARRLSLAERLADFLLTPSEWEEYQAIPKDGRPPFLKNFEDFYQHAQARDQSMSAHVLSLLKKGGERPLVLVTGGFHGRGMAEQLTRAGVTVVSFVPKIDRVEIDKGSVSLGLFTQEKTPLEKMFQKERLFLAPHPASPTVLKTLLPSLVAAMLLYMGGTAAGVDVQVIYQTLGGVGLLAVVKLLGDLVELKVIKKRGSASLRVILKSDGTIKGLSEQIERGSISLDEIKRWWATVQLPLPQFNNSPIMAMASNSIRHGPRGPTNSGPHYIAPVHVPVNNTGSPVPPHLLEFHQRLAEFIHFNLLSGNSPKTQAYKDALRDLIQKAGELSPLIQMFYEDVSIDSNFNSPQLLDLVVRTIYIPAGYCIARDTFGFELLRLNSINIAEYLGEEIYLVDVSRLDGTSTGALNPALNLPAGYIMLDTSSLTIKGEEQIVGKLNPGLTREEIIEMELQFALQTYASRSSMELFLKLKDDLDLHAVSGLNIVPAIVVPGGSADLHLKAGIKKIPEKDLGSLIPSELVELFLFSTQLEGMINALENLAETIGEKKAHAIGVLKLTEVVGHSEARLNRGSSRVNVVEHRGSEFFVARLKEGLRELRRAGGLSYTPAVWKITLKNELTKGSLSNYEGLIGLLKKIQGNNFYTPYDRYVQAMGRPPAPNEVVVHFGDITPREGSLRAFGPRQGQRRPRKPPSRLLQSLVIGAENRSAVEKAHRDAPVEKLISEMTVLLEGEAELHLDELIKVLEGEKGLRARVVHHAKVREVVELSMLIEELREIIADREANEKISECQVLVGQNKFQQAIQSFLEIIKDDNLTRNMSEEVNSNLNGLLESARTLFISSNQQPILSLEDVVRMPELFGLYQDEVEFLKLLPRISVDNLPTSLLFNSWGIGQIRRKLGKHAPPVLKELEDELKNQENLGTSSTVSTVQLAGGFDLLVDKDFDTALAKEMRDAILKIDKLIRNAILQQGEDTPTYDRAFARAKLRPTFRNILRFKTRTHRLYIRVFDENNENDLRRVIVIAALVNKGDTSEDGGLGDIDAQLKTKLLKYDEIGNLGSAALMNMAEPLPVRVKPKGSLASLADDWAWDKWGGDPAGYRSYIIYTFFGAPAWEWVYQMLPLNLWAQRGGANWILRRFFGKEDNNPVVLQVPGQVAVTLLGMGALGIGLWAGTWFWVLPGALVYSLASTYVFSEAHRGKSSEEMRFIFWLGFGLALAFIGPSLGLFLWDPVWLTGFGNLFYLGTLGVGWILSYVGHAGSQYINLHIKAKTSGTPPVEAVLNGSDLWEKLLSIERSVAVGDLGQAQEIWVGIRENVESIAPGTLEGQWIASLQQRLSASTEPNAKTEPSSIPQYFKEMEYDLFVERDFVSLFKTREIIEDLKMTDGQRDLLENWDKIIRVVSLFTTGQWEESDRQAAELETTARLFVRDHGIFQPYQERLLFGFLRDYRLQREISSASEVQQTLTDLSELQGRPIEKIAQIIYRLDQLKDNLNDYEKAALNVHAEYHNTSGSPVLVLRLPEFVVGKLGSLGLSAFKPLIVEAMNLIPEGATLTSFSEAIKKYIFIQQRDEFVSNLDQMGMTTADAWLLTEFLSIESARNSGLDDFPGMHAVGGETSEENRRIFQHIAGSKATVEVRRQWGNEIRGRLEGHRERRRAIQNLNLGNSIDQLLTLLEMENPTVKIGDRDIPVNFQLLPESWKQSSPGSQRADWYFRVRDNHEIESVEIILDRDDLGAVVHEGVEVVLSCLPYDKRPKGKPHTYAFLAEVLANDNGDDLVPQRALDEIDHKSLEELVDFLKGSAASLDEIENLFGDSSLFFAKKRLLDIHEKLERRASVMRDEREKDPLWLFNLQVAKAEKSIAVGALVQGQQDLKDLDRILYHLERTKGHHPLQSSLVAELQKRLNKIIEISEKIKEREQIHAWDFSDHLKKMEEQFRFRDFWRLLTSFGRVKTWTSGPLYPEQVMLAAFWIDIENILRPLIRDNDWNASDQKVQEFENRWLGELGRLGAGHMYLEGLLYEFLEAYRAQKKRGKDWSHYLAHENDDNTHGTPILVDFLDNYPNANTTLRVLSETALAVKAFMESKFASWQNNKGTSGINKQKGIALPEMALFLPGIVASVSLVGWVLVKGLTDPGLMFPSLLAATAGGLIVVGVIGVVVIYVSVRFGDFLERKKSAALGFALVLKKAEEEGDLAHGLRLDVAGQDLVRKASAEEGVWFRRYLKKAMAKLGVAPLSFAAARALISVKGWRAQVFEASAGVMPDAGGSRSLVIIYLNNDMVSGGVADVTERYSPGGEGILVFVPTDRGSRAAVSDMPDTFGGLIFDGGPGRADRVPSLAVVERRLAIAGVNFAQYTGCRVVTPVGMALDAEGVQSDLFKEALVILLNGMMGLVIKRKNLHSIDRAARAIVSAA
jgi:hypothetical protein